MGLQVNGVVSTSTMRCAVTGSFEVYQDEKIQVHLNAGQTTIVQFNVSAHGVSRVDELTVSPATASAPTGPTNLVGTAGNGEVALSWTASSGASNYNVYRRTKSARESLPPIATL